MAYTANVKWIHDISSIVLGPAAIVPKTQLHCYNALSEQHNEHVVGHMQSISD
jgi:hypothetical protein